MLSTSKKAVNRVKITTFNINQFAPKKSWRIKLLQLARIAKFDILLVQEAKKAHLRTLFSDSYWVFQRRKTLAKANAAVVGRRSVAKLGSKWLRMGVRADGVRMENRHITATRSLIYDRNVTSVSIHFPPRRFWFLAKYYMRNLEQFMQDYPGPYVFGCDLNSNPKRNKMFREFAKRHGLVIRSVGIIGFMISAELLPGEAFTESVHSDHPAVSVFIYV